MDVAKIENDVSLDLFVVYFISFRKQLKSEG